MAMGSAASISREPKRGLSGLAAQRKPLSELRTNKSRERSLFPAAEIDGEEEEEAVSPSVHRTSAGRNKERKALRSRAFTAEGTSVLPLEQNFPRSSCHNYNYLCLSPPLLEARLIWSLSISLLEDVSGIIKRLLKARRQGHSAGSIHLTRLPRSSQKTSCVRSLVKSNLLQEVR